MDRGFPEAEFEARAGRAQALMTEAGLDGLLVTINFHLLAASLRKSLTPPHLTSHNVVIAKYYLRFIGSGFIIFILIAGNYVNPLGLIIGLSVVVCSIMLATMCEIAKLIFKEAV